MAVVLMIIIVIVTVFQKVVFHAFFEEGGDGYTFSERRAAKRRHTIDAGGAV
jgi:hypothetical protein